LERIILLQTRLENAVGLSDEVFERVSLLEKKKNHKILTPIFVGTFTLTSKEIKQAEQIISGHPSPSNTSTSAQSISKLATRSSQAMVLKIFTFFRPGMPAFLRQIRHDSWSSSMIVENDFIKIKIRKQNFIDAGWNKKFKHQTKSNCQ
jgi:hypothetical protein